MRTLEIGGAAASLLLASACGSMMPMTPAMTPAVTPSTASIDNASLPDAVRVPSGEMQKAWTVGKGEITYECRAKKEMVDQYEWAFAGPAATLHDASGKAVGKYYGPPTTWEAMDGSKVGGKQVAVAPHQADAIPLQLVKAEPAVGSGAMQGVTYIQRLKTVGGVAPSALCAVANQGEKKQVAYQADYVFYGR